MNKVFGSKLISRRGRGIFRSAVMSAAAVSVMAAGAMAAADTAYVPFVVNVNATVTAQGTVDGADATISMPVTANVEKTLALPIKGTLSIWNVWGGGGGLTSPLITNSRGNITLRLPPQSYQNAEITLYSVNGKRILRAKAAASEAVSGISRRNVAAGVYILSAKGINGSAFTTRLTHSGGNLNINVAFGYPDRLLAKAAAAEDNDWEITVSADGYINSSYTLGNLINGTNAKQEITLQPVPVTLTGITAVYSGTATIYPTTSLDNLKTGLTVTANYSDNTNTPLASTDYVLSGGLTVGSSVVTVTYDGKETTFAVTVSAPVTLASITAAYSGTATIYPTTSLDGLKAGLAVTASYSNNTNAPLTSEDYALSGELTVGSSVVTVTYDGKETTFAVTVNKADPAVTWPQGLTADFGQTLNDVPLSGKGSGAGTFFWTNAAATVGAAGTRTHNMTFVPDDEDNYNTLDHDVSITVAAVTAASLTLNEWKDGDVASGGVQWFSFAATASTQYIHASFGTLSYFDVRLYDSNGNAVEDETTLTSSNRYISRPATSGQLYYIRVRPYSSNSGTYQIAFNTSTAAPGIALPANPTALTAADKWVNGNIAANGREWFVFTATAETQYVHVAFGTLGSLYVQIYDSNGNTVESETNLQSSVRSISRALTPGQTYYISVRPFNSTISGTYQIAFNASAAAPATSIPLIYTTLNASQWESGSIASTTGEQWFSFTANVTGWQYIHVAFGTLTGVRVQLYDSEGNTEGSSSSLYGDVDPPDWYLRRQVTSGNTYYIKVWPYSGSGTYQIMFNTTLIPPNVTALAAANQWANGTLTAYGLQWYSRLS